MRKVIRRRGETVYCTCGMAIAPGHLYEVVLGVWGLHRCLGCHVTYPNAWRTNACPKMKYKTALGLYAPALKTHKSHDHDRRYQHDSRGRKHIKDEFSRGPGL